eukprot:jgi/Chlat1/5125/Chrsp33S05127
MAVTMVSSVSVVGKVRSPLIVAQARPAPKGRPGAKAAPKQEEGNGLFGWLNKFLYKNVFYEMDEEIAKNSPKLFGEGTPLEKFSPPAPKKGLFKK